MTPKQAAARKATRRASMGKVGPNVIGRIDALDSGSSQKGSVASKIRRKTPNIGRSTY